MAAQNWPSITLALLTTQRFWLLRTLTLSSSCHSASSTAAACSAKSLRRIALRARVCPLSGSFTLYTLPVGDFESSLRISNWPSFVGISSLLPSVTRSARRPRQTYPGGDSGFELKDIAAHGAIRVTKVSASAGWFFAFDLELHPTP